MEGNGEPLLLLHGMTGCHEDWEYVGRQEFLRKYRLITPDARWHGRSTNPEKIFSHRQCAHDTLALLNHLGIQRCRAIGVSMGGNILLHVATLEPERIEDGVGQRDDVLPGAGALDYAGVSGGESAGQRVGEHAASA